MNERKNKYANRYFVGGCIDGECLALPSGLTRYNVVPKRKEKIGWIDQEARPLPIESYSLRAIADSNGRQYVFMIADKINEKEALSIITKRYPHVAY